MAALLFDKAIAITELVGRVLISKVWVKWWEDVKGALGSIAILFPWNDLVNSKGSGSLVLLLGVMPLEVS